VAAARPAPSAAAPTWSNLGGTPAPPVDEAGVGTVLAYSASGALLGGTGNGVWRYTGGTWRPLGRGLPPAPVTALASGPDGTLYAGLADAGVWALRGTRWVKDGGSGSPLARAVPNALAPVPCAGALLAGTEAGLWAWERGAWVPVGGLPSGPLSVDALAAKAGGSAVAAVVGGAPHPAEDGVWVDRRGRWRRLPGLPPRARQLMWLPGGALAAGTSDGVWRHAGGSWSRLGGPASPVAGDRIQSLALLPSGALVAAAARPGRPAGGGVWRYAAGRWAPLGHAASGPGTDQVDALAVGPGGRLTAAAAIVGPSCDAGAIGRVTTVQSDGLWAFADGSWTRLPGGRRWKPTCQ
jgi:hypothetical protein